MKKSILFSIAIIFALNTSAQDIDSTQMTIDQIEQSLNYSFGSIEFENATLNVPKGFKYLNKEQSVYVLSDLWGNPVDNEVLGLLVPENKGVLEIDSWVFTLNYSELGYVEDDDAEDIDYDDLLEELQKETLANNPMRVQMGYGPIELIDWASKPYYDSEKKVLHWAKELNFDNDTLNTLNYDLRILGRKGVFVMSAVASMSELNEVKNNIGNVIQSVDFKEGHKYADFVPGVDNVAAWTIGGLVAGKVLTKVGFFALILKFWKVIALAVAGFGGTIWKFFGGKKKERSTSEDTNELPENIEA